MDREGVWAFLCSLYGPCSSVTTCISFCTPTSGFSWERTLSFAGDARVEHHLPSQASQHAYKQEGRFCCSCVWAFCFSWGGEGALAFSNCSRKAESAYSSALLAFLSIQPHSRPREAALSTAPLPTPAV